MEKIGHLKVTTPSEREIVMEREFDAPRQLVFDAWTKPEILKRWFGVRNGWTMSKADVDLRVGGSYHFRWRNSADGTEFGFTGTYREITAPDRFVHSERFDHDPDDDAFASINTYVFVEKHGKTTLTIRSVFPSKDVRDQALASGMANGVEESFEVLAALWAR